MSLPDFLISDASIEQLFSSLKLSCLNTGTKQSPSFGNESSFLSSTITNKSATNTVLAIDVGGTRTKVCVRSIKNALPDWQEIIDLDNNQLKSEGPGSALCRMTMELARQISISCHDKKIELKFDGVAIVWSNKLESFPLDTEIKGVGARVFGSKAGAYRKGEWWNADISEGDDISAAFIAGLKAASIQSKILIIANDTVFTAKALPGALAGVVASTGANTTIVPVNSSILFNSECAVAIEIPESFLNLQITPARLPGTNNPLKLEDIAAGKGLPRVFHILINEAIACGENELQLVSDALHANPLNAKELGLIVAGQLSQGLANRLTQQQISQSIADKLTVIAQQLIRNAGKMCALLILISVANQLDSDSEILVALDSSQARFVPGYKESLDDFLSAWNSKHKKRVRYQLLSPEGQISVPLRGAANAIEQFL